MGKDTNREVLTIATVWALTLCLIVFIWRILVCTPSTQGAQLQGQHICAHLASSWTPLKGIRNLPSCSWLQWKFCRGLCLIGNYRGLCGHGVVLKLSWYVSKQLSDQLALPTSNFCFNNILEYWVYFCLQYFAMEVMAAITPNDVLWYCLNKRDTAELQSCVKFWQGTVHWQWWTSDSIW